MKICKAGQIVFGSAILAAMVIASPASAETQSTDGSKTATSTTRTPRFTSRQGLAFEAPSIPRFGTPKAVASNEQPQATGRVFYQRPAKSTSKVATPRSTQTNKVSAQQVSNSRSGFSLSKMVKPASSSKPSYMSTGLLQSGKASWYGSDFHGGKTANGETYDMNSQTAAHRTLPFGTMVKVTNLNNGQETVVRVNNRGPFREGRIIDLSKGAASQLGMISRGIASVKLEVLKMAGQ
jgi:rare lipoprotein A (peptidoglycan hydrolase)